MTKYEITFDSYDDYELFPTGVRESEYGEYDTKEEATKDAVKILNGTKKMVEDSLKVFNVTPKTSNVDKFLKIAATIWLLEEAITSAIHFILWRFVE